MRDLLGRLRTRAANSLIVQTLWCVILILLIVLFYQGQTPFVYARF